jgi:hypothetical protein
MRHFKSHTKKAAVLGATLLALVAVGLVYAAWITSGSGSVYAKAGTSQALSTLDASASTTATLYPGSTGDVVLKVSNPNAFPVRVTGVSLNGTNASIAADAGHSGCTTTGVSFTNATGLTVDVPAKAGATNGSVEATLSGAAAMSNASVDACQGATFTIPVTLTGASNAS